MKSARNHFTCFYAPVVFVVGNEFFKANSGIRSRNLLSAKREFTLFGLKKKHSPPFLQHAVFCVISNCGTGRRATF